MHHTCVVYWGNSEVTVGLVLDRSSCVLAPLWSVCLERQRDRYEGQLCRRSSGFVNMAKPGFVLYVSYSDWNLKTGYFQHKRKIGMTVSRPVGRRPRNHGDSGSTRPRVLNQVALRHDF